MGTIFYISSVVVSLYAAYLFAFKTYQVNYMDEKTHKKLVYPRICYILALFIIFIPFLNLLSAAGYFLGIFLGMYWIDSWLFNKPNINNNNNKDDKE